MTEYFKIKPKMWVEVKRGWSWVVGQIVSITEDGKRVEVETHEDIYEVSRSEIRQIEE